MHAVRAARLFDGVADGVAEQPVVLSTDGRIVAIHRGGQTRVDMEVIDLGDVTLLPGLVDCHMHPVFDASDDPIGHLAALDDSAVLVQARAAARRARSRPGSLPCATCHHAGSLVRGDRQNEVGQPFENVGSRSKVSSSIRTRISRVVPYKQVASWWRPCANCTDTASGHEPAGGSK